MGLLLTLLHSEWPKLHRALAILSAIGLKRKNLIQAKQILSFKNWGWSGGAMVLGKLPVPGRPTIGLE